MPTVSGTEIREDEDGLKLANHRQSVVVIAGPDRGLRREVRSSRVTLGTGSQNTVVLTDRSVSRRHCEIVPRRDGSYLVRDFDSTNGTKINGIRVTEAELPPRARLRLGDTELRFEPKRKWERVQPLDQTELAGLIFGQCPLMRQVMGAIARIAESDLSVVVAGETGTGKELASRALHQLSDRVGRPFVVVDCGAIVSSLIESELFGHVRGAFTGANRSHDGAFVRADQGTIFLDEVGELPLAAQAKFLRALQTRTVRPLGSDEEREVDVRIVAATHQPLQEMVRVGSFREDLYHRLTEVVIQLPPLRDRGDDIRALALRFLAEPGVVELGMHDFSPDALKWLSSQPWPGNVRQLRNLVRRACVVSDGPTLSLEDLTEVAHLDEALARDPADAALAKNVLEDVLAADDSLAGARDRWNAALERAYLTRTVDRAEGSLERAAEIAGMHKKSLARLLRKHGIEPP